MIIENKKGKRSPTSLSAHVCPGSVLRCDVVLFILPSETAGRLVTGLMQTAVADRAVRHT
jgi:hypothetical protein